MRELDSSVEERNYAKDGLSAGEVRRIVAAAGSVGAVLNARHAVAKEQGWKERPPTPAEFAKAAAETPNLLRRPILVRSGRAVVGRDLDAIRELLSGPRG